MALRGRRFKGDCDVPSRCPAFTKSELCDHSEHFIAAQRSTASEGHRTSNFCNAGVQSFGQNGNDVKSNEANDYEGNDKGFAGVIAAIHHRLRDLFAKRMFWLSFPATREGEGK